MASGAGHRPRRLYEPTGATRVVRGESTQVRAASHPERRVRKAGRLVQAAARVTARVGHAHQVWLVQKVGTGIGCAVKGVAWPMKGRRVSVKTSSLSRFDCLLVLC